MTDNSTPTVTRAPSPADIVLAECNGQAWLVHGEQHIDDLLANTLPPELSIEVIACQSKTGIKQLHIDYGADEHSEMWVINPAIFNRTKGKTGALEVRFAEWSAKMDDVAQAAMLTAADMLAHDASAVLALVAQEPRNAPEMVSDLRRLRINLLRARLTAMGIAAERLVEDVATATDEAQADVIALSVRPS